MAGKKQIGTHLETDSDLWADFVSYMDTHGIETNADGMRMAIKHACQPYRMQRRIAKTLLYAITWMGLLSGVLYAGLLIFPENRVLITVTRQVALLTIGLGVLFPPVTYPIAKHRKQRGEGYLQQLRMAVASTITTKSRVAQE